MDKLPEATLTLTVAAEHYVAAAQRGVIAGREEEQSRIISLLKKNGQYAAVLIIKGHVTAPIS
jgi:hypothetical protein